ncbi:MAG: 30S ribosomal protein S7 [bacterium]
MPRKKKISKREIIPDFKYKSPVVTNFVNVIMKKGKKSLAQRIVYDFFGIVEEKTHKDPLEIFNQAIDKAKPILQTKSRRIGGATYQVPMEVPANIQLSLVIRWIIGFAKKRGERGMAAKLAGEFLDIINNTGATLKKKEDVHKMAAANKAFAHYKW